MGADVQNPPGGLSLASFRALCAETGLWLWGTVQGAFNDKASFSQIMVDAVIGMVPLVGDVTAVRDLIAVTVGMVDDPKKRESTWEWVLLVVLLFALIPIYGGVIKGAGRIVVKLVREAEALSGAARIAHMQQGAREIVAFLNRIGVRNAEEWLLALRTSEYQAKLTERFNSLLNTMIGVLVAIRRRAGQAMPQALGRRIDSLRGGLDRLKETGGRMIPEAVKEFDQKLREIQAWVRAGGETTSRKALHDIAAGKPTVTRTDEARLLENGPLPKRSAHGGFQQNTANKYDPESYKNIYKPQTGYPDLTCNFDQETGQMYDLMSYSGGIVNRTLQPNEQIYRSFGPEGITHGEEIGASRADGVFWALAPTPEFVIKWRGPNAVVDEFNRSGYVVEGLIVNGTRVKAAVGTAAEQSSKKIPGQYFPGGGTQAIIEFPNETRAKLASLGDMVMKTQQTQTWIDPATGVHFTVRRLDWKDANGIHGYLHMPGPGSVQTARLGSRELATKENREVAR